MPPDIRLEWARHDDREDDLKFLLDFLSAEVERRERSLTYECSKKSQAVQPPPTHSCRDAWVSNGAHYQVLERMWRMCEAPFD